MPSDATRVISLTVYSRPGCHLCEDMKTVVARVVTRSGVGSGEGEPALAVQEIDISGNAELESRYGLEIPVLLIDGRKVAKYRVGEAELLRLLADRQSR
jgi:glutaredoxin